MIVLDQSGERDTLIVFDRSNACCCEKRMTSTGGGHIVGGGHILDINICDVTLFLRSAEIQGILDSNV